MKGIKQISVKFLIFIITLLVLKATSSLVSGRPTSKEVIEEDDCQDERGLLKCMQHLAHATIPDSSQVSDDEDNEAQDNDTRHIISNEESCQIMTRMYTCLHQYRLRCVVPRSDPQELKGQDDSDKEFRRAFAENCPNMTLYTPRGNSIRGSI